MHKPYTNKTDIWSIGTIFYEMLHGKSPFPDVKSQEELKNRIQTAKIIYSPDISKVIKMPYF